MGRALLVGLVALLALAVISGLVLTGGPFAARQDKMDLRRLEDLARLSDTLNCAADGRAVSELPEMLTLETLRNHCGGMPVLAEMLLDSETGAPYAYERLSDWEYTLCATFTDADKTSRRGRVSFDRLASFNPETGCVSGKVN